ncbi:ABC transporter permease [Hymenobacter chitinivorans]|uniref:Putative ABC transport system permease protein n=1 Tax=Hymenobacter chitinivorans DSM 11115 TaxID=1121954 RepID=A0A2M9B5C4_9BACT|nr:FtsX-like permease family protein [Hymenobacter chitinivorans]PJJ53140.1 putative ABC transport system permease protein [Hymenobacter chitinivorans DSM 11115]
MLLNYLKIAWKVLLRRRFFTFISLFGTSLTLMVLLVLYAIFDYTVGPHTPETQVDRLVFINRIQLVAQEGGQSNGFIGYSFLDRYVRPMRTPEKISLSEGNYNNVEAYVGESTLKLDRKLTDSEFWQVLNFDFVAGRPYTAAEVREAALVAVINESTSRKYFGTTTNVIGRTFEAGAVHYRVVGVVRDVPISRSNSYADFWVPLTTTSEDLRDPGYIGNYQAIALARQSSDVATIQQEYERVVGQVPLPDPKKYKAVHSYARTLLASLTARFNNNADAEGGVGRMMQVSLVMALLFMLLPALNLVNVNVSRMLERSSEIGVRKAFGATSRTLVTQFLFENIFLTLLGGLLGLALAAGALMLLNYSQFMPYSDFALNARVFGAGILTALFFGALSGAYPAYKMSKMPVVQALKADFKV